MKINNARPPHKKHRTALIILAIIVLAVIGYGAYAYVTKSAWPFDSATPAESISDTDRADDGINYAPLTEEELLEGQAAKKRLSEPEGGTEPADDRAPDQPKSTVSVAISYADIFEGNLEVRAFMPSVIQGTGECTATVKKSGAPTITEKSPAFIDSSSTICQPIYIPTSQLSSGTWTVSVAYSSPTHQGSSSDHKVEVK